MEDSIVFLLLIQVILIALNAIFASAEIAVLSTNETKMSKLAEEGNIRISIPPDPAHQRAIPFPFHHTGGYHPVRFSGQCVRR